MSNMYKRIANNYLHLLSVKSENRRCKSKHRPFCDNKKKKKIEKKLLQACIFVPNVIDLCRQWWRSGNVRCCKRLVIGPFVGRFIST